jgi:zinc transport system substrate-binding protein
MIFRAFLCFILLAFTAPPARADASRVIASIKPLHSLVAAVMGDTGTPELLVGGLQSPHGYQLKPSQVAALNDAAIVFYIGSGLETFLTQPLGTLPPTVRKIALIDAPGVTVLKPRSGGAWEPDEDETPARPAQDPHIWLDTDNAKAMAAEIARVLGETYPANKDTYNRNEAALAARLDALNTALASQLKSAAGRPYIVFHDAFQYFERDYGLTAAGAITLEPEQEPGAKRIAEIREKIRTSGVQCVFSEPQFNTRLIQTVAEGAPVKTGILDEHGADIEEGPELYFSLMQNLATGFERCLKPSIH